jgi:membrane protein YdbS with pleckstrin-like domain
MFQNPEIDLDALPDADHLQWQGLDPTYKRRLRVQLAIVVVIVTVALAIPTIVVNVPFKIAALIIGAVIFVAAGLMIWPAVAVPRRGYVVRDKDIVFRSGVVWRSVTAVPFNRIQHVETSSDPLDRKFDLATLKIFTAGGSGGDLKIDGLGKDIAEQLRAFILKKVGTIVENA